MNCMNCTENMVAKRKDKRCTSTSSSVLRPLRPPANQTSWQTPSSACHDGETKGPVIVKEMPFFCFEVLFSQIYRLEPPRVPTFTNDP